MNEAGRAKKEEAEARGSALGDHKDDKDNGGPGHNAGGRSSKDSNGNDSDGGDSDKSDGHVVDST